MSYRLIGRTCTGCDRVPPRPATHGDLCADCYRLATPADRAVEICRNAATAAMGRTLQEIRALDETEGGE